MKLLNCLFLLILALHAGYGQNKKSASKNTVQFVPTKYAIVIGISEYEDSTYFPHLQYSKSDAERFYEFLLKGYIKDIKPENIIKITTSPLTPGESLKSNYIDVMIGSRLAEIEDIAKGGDCVFIYWSGHGAVSNTDQSLACYNTKYKEDYYQDGGLSFDVKISRIKSAIVGISKKPGVKVFLIVDACRSKLKGVDQIPLAVSIKTEFPETQGDIYLYSASGGESSFETSLLVPGSGVFTYFLLLGLKGAADDTQPYNQVSVGEIERYLGQVKTYVTNVLRGNPQQPRAFYSQLANDNLPITEVSSLVRKLAIKSSDSLKHIIDSAREALIASQNAQEGVVSFSKGPTFNYNVTTQAILQHNEQDNKEIQKNNFAEQNVPATATDVLYDSVLLKITKNELLQPSGYSAYDYYIKLQNSNADRKIVTDARLRLVIALQEKVEVFIDTYMQGKLPGTRKNTFDLAFEELQRAYILRSDADSLRIALLPKLKFLEARALASSRDPLDWNRGLNVIDTALAISKTAYMLHTKGVLFQNKSRFYTAIKYFDSTIVYAPNWTYALYNLATTYYQIQEYEKSIDYCKNVLERDSNYSRIYSWLAYNYETITDNKVSGIGVTEDYKTAIDYNLKALQIDSTNTYAYLNLGRIYSKINDDKKEHENLAIDYFFKGGVRYKYSQCLTWLGKMYEKKHVLILARNYYKNAWELDNYDTAALDNYAYFLFEQNEKERSDSLYHAALEKTKDTAKNLYDYKFLSKYRSFAFRTKSPSIADSIFRQIILTNSEDPYIFIEHSKQWESIDSISKAGDILRLGLERIPGSPSLNYAMAQLLVKHNPYLLSDNTIDSSIFFLRNSLIAAPTSSLINYSLGQLHLIKNNIDSAQRYLTKADSLNKFIYYTVNLNNDIRSSGESAIKRKNYVEATAYYKLADNLSEHQASLIDNDTLNKQFSLTRIQSTLSLIRLSYLDNQLDSAVAYSNKLQAYWLNLNVEGNTDIYNTIQQKKLMGLIEIDRKQKQGYRKAIDIFSELNNTSRSNNNYLEQAVAHYCLGEKKTAIQLAISYDTKSRVANYRDILKQEGTDYSANFVANLRKLIKDVGTRFFEETGANNNQK